MCPAPRSGGLRCLPRQVFRNLDYFAVPQPLEQSQLHSRRPPRAGPNPGKSSVYRGHSYMTQRMTRFRPTR